jgi:SAM-dependent methyltransferase
MSADPGGAPTYSAAHFAPLFAAEDRHFWFQSRNRCILAALKRVKASSNVRSILEVGCGTGVVLAALQRMFPESHITGMDLFEDGLALARRRFGGTLIQGDVLTQRFDARLDMLGAFDVIEHLDDDQGVLERFRDQLVPGGHVIITVPAYPSLWSYFDEIAHHRRRYSPDEVRRKLLNAGFVNVYVTPFMTALFPVMWLKRRIFGRQLSGAPPHEQQTAAERDLRVPMLINLLMDVLLWPDAQLISHRRRLPFGTSLLAVAETPK